MDFAKAVRIARAARGVSQRDLATAAGIRPSYLSMIERGARANPSTATVRKLADALDLPVTLLMLLGAEADDLNHMAPDEANRLARSLLDALTSARSNETRT